MERVRIVADALGQRVALVEPGRVLLLELPGLVPAAELGIAGDLDDHDVRFVGDAGRLVVLTRSAGRAVLHVVDPAGPTKLGEVQFRTVARVLASIDNYALTVAGNVAAVTDVSLPSLVAIPLPTRGVITAAAPIGPHRFAIAISGAIEEWDAAVRTPGRRLRLDRPIDPIALGGNAQRLFVVARDAPDIVEVVTLGTRSTRKLELPEPAARIAAHPGGDVIAVVGATTQSVYLLDLVRGTPVRLDRSAITDVAWIGGGHALAIKPEGAELELLAVESAGEPARRPALVAVEAPERGDRGEPGDAGEGADAEAPAAGESAASAAPAASGAPAAPSDGAATVEGSAPPTQWSRQEISHRLAAWRNRFGSGGAGASNDAPAAGDPPDDAVDPTLDPRARVIAAHAQAPGQAARAADPRQFDRDERGGRPHGRGPDDGADHGVGPRFDEPDEPDHPDRLNRVHPDHRDHPGPVARPDPPDRFERVAAGHPGGWRGELAVWARAVDAGSVRSPPTDPRPELDLVCTRLGLAADLAVAVALLYGAHLGGLRGIAPLELASVAGWRWSEALGAGALAAAGVVRAFGARARLAEEVLATLDGRPPAFGIAIGAHHLQSEIAATHEAVALVAPPSIALPALGAWAAPALGALLIPNARGEQAPARFVLEARLRGLAPLVPWDRFRATLADPPHPGAIVVEHAATAADLELPVVATWASGPEQGGAASA